MLLRRFLFEFTKKMWPNNVFRKKMKLLFFAIVKYLSYRLALFSELLVNLCVAKIYYMSSNLKLLKNKKWKKVPQSLLSNKFDNSVEKFSFLKENTANPRKNTK